VTDLHGLSRLERIEIYRSDPERHKFKEARNCLKGIDCRECGTVRTCRLMYYKEKLGFKLVYQNGKYVWKRTHNPKFRRRKRIPKNLLKV
jgi:hypothetical protein